MTKIKELTEEQKAAMPRYKQMGIDMGLKTGVIYDKAHVEATIIKHREMCGVTTTPAFYHHESPYAAVQDPTFEGKINQSNALYGQHDSSWLINYLFYRVECGLVEETNKIVHLLELAKHVGWMWMCSDAVVVTSMPTELHMIPKADGTKVCHNEDGYAIKYRDGNGSCALNGLRIPRDHHKFIFTAAKDLSAKEVLAISNTEVRGEVIKKMGVEFMFDQLDSKVIDKASVERGGEYTLYELDIEGQLRRYLSGICPSKGNRWYEAVPPNVSSVLQANLWREWGTMTGSYLPPSVRT